MTSLFCPDDDVLVRIHAALSPRARASVPITPEQLVRLVETAFWASLEVNEGRATRDRIALVAAGHVSDGTVFSAPVPYDAQQIAKLGPATPQEGCLLVTVADDGLWVWGLGRGRPAATHILRQPRQDRDVEGDASVRPRLGGKRCRAARCLCAAATAA